MLFSVYVPFPVAGYRCDLLACCSAHPHTSSDLVHHISSPEFFVNMISWSFLQDIFFYRFVVKSGIIMLVED